MRKKGLLLGTTLMVIGTALVAVSILTTFSGLGGPRFFPGTPIGFSQTPPPGVVALFGAKLYIGPAFFTGLALLAVGAFFMWEGPKTLGVRLGRGPGSAAGLRR